MDDYVTKPIRVDALVEALLQVRPRARREARRGARGLGAVAAGGERARAGAGPLRLPLRRRRRRDDARGPAGRRLAARRRRRAAARRRQPVLAAHRCRALRAADPGRGQLHARPWKSPCTRTPVAGSPRRATSACASRSSSVPASSATGTCCFRPFALRMVRCSCTCSVCGKEGFHGRGPGLGRAGRHPELQFRPPGCRPVLCHRHAGGGRAGRARPRPGSVRLCRALRLARRRRMAAPQRIWSPAGRRRRCVAARPVGWRWNPSSMLAAAQLLRLRERAPRWYRWMVVSGVLFLLFVP